jgi:signal transduction histidine kinase
MVSSSARRAWIADSVMAAVATSFFIALGFTIADDSGEQYGGWAIATIVVVGGAIAFRRISPEPVLGVMVGGLLVYTVAGFAGGPVYLASLFPLYTIAATGDRRRTFIAVSAVGVAYLVMALVSGERGEHVLLLLAFAGWVAGAIFLGSAQHNRWAYLAQLEQRARDLEDSRDEEARRRIAEERLRIARDLHDVIAHGIATIHLQSSVALHVLARKPEQAKLALTTVKELSKQTLGELRTALDVVRADDNEPVPLAPTPGLDRLGPLVDVSRQAGLPVELRLFGDADSLPPAVDVAAYRIVQESLTNVMRHAGEHAVATVTVSRGRDAVDVEIVDDGLGAAAASPNGGHGLVGMRERATSVGGVVVAGFKPGGGFRVHAHLPYEPRPEGGNG